MSGPLDGLRVLELAGLGPAPYACMVLADAGADVVRVDRASGDGPLGDGEPSWDLLNRGRRSVAVDLKRPEGAALALDMAAVADVLVEGWRPGVAERLGLGPDQCLERNPRLVYGRMTGWGQEGPLAQRAGHDIDYIALAGALYGLGRSDEPPVPPMNLVGDFGGGGMLLAFGVVAAVLEARQSGRGQVVDAAMVDGAASLMTMTYAFEHIGQWSEQRGTNILDTGAHFYEVYETADGKWFAVGAIEPQFYDALLRGLGLHHEALPAQYDRTQWPAMKQRFAGIFRTRSRDEWEEIFEGTDACAAPVLSPLEAPNHPHLRERATFVEVAGVLQPAPAPRFVRTPGEIRRPPPVPGAGGDAAVAEWGIDPQRMARLRQAKVVD